MKIALDMEGVLADSHRVVDQLLLEECGIKFNHDTQATRWSAWELIGIPERAYLILGGRAWLERDVGVYDSFSGGIVEALRHVGHEVDILTARGAPRIADIKREWLKEHVAGSPKLVEPPRGVSKGKMPYDLLIDDGLHNIVSQVGEGKRAIIYDRVWNRGCMALELTKRYRSLADLQFEGWLR